MKSNIYSILIFFFLISCSTTTKVPRYKQLMQNYEFLDRIVNNPDSLEMWIRDSSEIRDAVHHSNTFGRENNKDLDNNLINKIKLNDFKDGYSYYDERLSFSELKTYLKQRIWIQSNKTGKKLFFYFDNKNGIWQIRSISLKLHVFKGNDLDKTIE
jgi:hypothetical protein